MRPLNLNNKAIENKEWGLTLIELMVVLSILSLLAFIAIPAFNTTIEKNRLTTAAEQLYYDLQYAKTEALKTNQHVYVSFSVSPSSWCYGISTTTCNCFAESQCKIANTDFVRTGAEYANIDLQQAKFAGGANYTAFEPTRGRPSANGMRNGSIWFRDSSNRQVAVVLNRIGRIRICSPQLANYPANCPKAP